MISDDVAVADPEILTLRQLVESRRVCWEVYPKMAETEAGLLRIGTQLELLGAVDHTPGTLAADSTDDVYQDLVRIARWISTEPPASHRFIIEPFDGGVEFSPRRKFRTEVTVAVDLVHSEPWDAPVDEHISAMLRHVEEKLRLIGAKTEHW